MRKWLKSADFDRIQKNQPFAEFFRASRFACIIGISCQTWPSEEGSVDITCSAISLLPASSELKLSSMPANISLSKVD
jgi:hypothetical protein